MHTKHKLHDIDRGIELRPGDPVYLQIADHFKKRVALRQLAPGRRLPAIRSLAEMLDLDPGTVARAYRELEREGIITSRRGSGSYICAPAASRYLSQQREKRLAALMEKTVLEALGLGFGTEEIESAFILHLADCRDRGIRRKGRKRAAVSSKSNEIRFAGSHDLAVELLATHTRALFPGLRFTARFTGSIAGLLAVERLEADIAGAHLLDDESGKFNTPLVKRLMPAETVVVMNLVQRVQGLMVAPGNPKHVLGMEDLARPDIVFINRQKGAGTRMLLDSRLRRLGISPALIKGYEREENTHVAVAAAVADGRADAGLGAQSAASTLGLDFIPLVKERYDLVALQDSLERPPLNRLQEVICSDSYQGILRAIPGYDTTETGKIVLVGPGPGGDYR